MRVKDKDRQRRLARDERRKKPKKRSRCKHERRTSVGISVTKCLDCGARIVVIGR